MKFLLILGSLILLPGMRTEAGETFGGFEFRFALLHTVRDKEAYGFTANPSIEALYGIRLNEKWRAAAGVLFQAGTHNWQLLTAHTVYPDLPHTPFPLKGMYDRQLRYVCGGIPLKFEKVTSEKFISARYIQITVGRYFQIHLEDSYNSSFRYRYDVGYHGLFQDVQAGLIKDLYNHNHLVVRLTALAGYRNQHLDGHLDNGHLTKYLYFGLGLGIGLFR